jgi:hypothetical protein
MSSSSKGWTCWAWGAEHGALAAAERAGRRGPQAVALAHGPAAGRAARRGRRGAVDHQAPDATAAPRRSLDGRGSSLGDQRCRRLARRRRLLAADRGGVSRSCRLGADRGRCWQRRRAADTSLPEHPQHRYPAHSRAQGRRDGLRLLLRSRGARPPALAGDLHALAVRAAHGPGTVRPGRGGHHCPRAPEGPGPGSGVGCADRDSAGRTAGGPGSGRPVRGVAATEPESVGLDRGEPGGRPRMHGAQWPADGRPVLRFRPPDRWPAGQDGWLHQQCLLRPALPGVDPRAHD